MFIVKRKIKRGKAIKKYRTYYLIAETEYIDGKPRQRILKYLGTAENILNVFKKKKVKRRKNK